MIRTWLYAVSKKVDVKQVQGRDDPTIGPIHGSCMGTTGPIPAGRIHLFHLEALPLSTNQTHR